MPIILFRIREVPVWRDKHGKKIRDFLYELCNYLELIMAVIVVAGIVIAALGLMRGIFAVLVTERAYRIILCYSSSNL